MTPTKEYKFIPGATITITDICNTKATFDEFNRFHKYYSKCGFMRNEPIPVDKKMIAYCSDKCFINWLIKIGKLKRAEIFQPFTIEIPINSPEEYWEVWHRMNAGAKSLDGYRRQAVDTIMIDFDNSNSHKLWREVEKYREEPWKKQL